VACQEAAEVEACVDAGEPALVDFCRGMLSCRVCFLLDAPFTSNFPDEVHRFRNDDGV